MKLVEWIKLLTAYGVSILGGVAPVFSVWDAFWWHSERGFLEYMAALVATIPALLIGCFIFALLGHTFYLLWGRSAK